MSIPAVILLTLSPSHPLTLLPCTVAAVSFLWTVIISLMRGTLDKKGKGEKDTPTTMPTMEPTTIVLAADK